MESKQSMVEKMDAAFTNILEKVEAHHLAQAFFFGGIAFSILAAIFGG